MVNAHSMLYKMNSVSKMFEHTVNLSLKTEPFSADATVQYCIQFVRLLFTNIRPRNQTNTVAPNVAISFYMQRCRLLFGLVYTVTSTSITKTGYFNLKRYQNVENKSSFILSVEVGLQKVVSVPNLQPPEHF